MKLTGRDFFIVRKARLLTGAEMAGLLGISESMVNHIENGRYPLSERIARKVIEIFDLTPEKLNDYRERWEEYERIKSEIKNRK